MCDCAIGAIVLLYNYHSLSLKYRLQVASTSTYPMENISPAPPATPAYTQQHSSQCTTPSPFAPPTTPYPNFQGYHGGYHEAQHPPEMSAVYPQLAGQGLFPPEQRPPLHELQPASQPPPSLHELQPPSQPPPSLLQPPSQPPPSLLELQPPSQGSEESEHSANDDHTVAEVREETAPALTGEHTPAATATPKRASTTLDATPSAAAVPKVHLLSTSFPQYFAFTPITSHNIVHTFSVRTHDH